MNKIIAILLTVILLFISGTPIIKTPFPAQKAYAETCIYAVDGHGNIRFVTDEVGNKVRSTVSNANTVKDLEGPNTTGGVSVLIGTGDYANSKDSAGNTVHEGSLGLQTPTRFTPFGIVPLPGDVHGGKGNTYIPLNIKY